MISIIENVFITCKIPGFLNQTYVALIPKIAQAKHVKDYRPISLCNTTYKIISQIIATILKIFLPKLISQEQSAFLPHRRTTDNIILAQELMQYVLKSKTKRK